MAAAQLRSLKQQYTEYKSHLKEPTNRQFYQKWVDQNGDRIEKFEANIAESASPEVIISNYISKSNDSNQIYCEVTASINGIVDISGIKIPKNDWMTDYTVVLTEENKILVQKFRLQQ